MKFERQMQVIVAISLFIPAWQPCTSAYNVNALPEFGKQVWGGWGPSGWCFDWVVGRYSGDGGRTPSTSVRLRLWVGLSGFQSGRRFPYFSEPTCDPEPTGASRSI